MKPIYSFLTAALIAVGANAQDLNREITVEREISPVEKDAQRLPLLPELNLPAVKSTGLKAASRAVVTEIPGEALQLAPVERDDPEWIEPRRGYVMAGVGGPAFNGELSAGYMILDKERTRLGAWLQWDSEVYERGDAWWRMHQGTVGLDLLQRVGRNGLLDADLNWNFGRFNQPLGPAYWQTMNNVDGRVGWHSHAGGMTYDVVARYSHFAYAKPGHECPDPQLTGIRQNRFGAEFAGSIAAGDNSRACLRVDLDLLHSSRNFLSDAATRGILTLEPEWRLETRLWHIAVAPRINFSFNAGKFFHIAPKVTAAWTPSAMLAVDATLDGGERFNPLAELALLAPRQVPYMAYWLSHVPLTVDAGITAGPWRGAWIRLHGGWATANNWLMPTLWESNGIAWTETGVSGAHVGAGLGWRLRKLVEVTADYTTAPGSRDHANIRWRDRARHVVDARINVRPINALSVQLGYELRACRSLWTDAGPLNLGNVSNLSLSATYALTPSLSVWLNGSNLLNRNCYAIDLTPAQGINATIGAALKF